MGCRPASQVQQTAFHIAMDKYMPPKWRHRIALYADDMAAGANTLEELFEIYKVSEILVLCYTLTILLLTVLKIEPTILVPTRHNTQRSR